MRVAARRLWETACGRPVLAVGLLALVLRAAVAVTIAVAHHGTLFMDDVTYSHTALDYAEGRQVDGILWRNATPLLLPVSLIYELFGELRIGAQLYVALLGAGAAMAAVRLAMELMPVRWAIAAGAVVAVLPSQVLFSSVILKDASVWLCLAGLGLAVAVAARSSARGLLALAALAVALLLLLGRLRPETLVIACWALPLATLFGIRLYRWRQLTGALVIAVVLPWAVFGHGPAGVSVIADQSGAAGLIREQSAQALAERSDVPEEDINSGFGADLDSLPGGVSAMLLEPTPFQEADGTAMQLARIEIVLWYPILALALVGLLSVRRRHLGALAFPLLAGTGVVLAWALVHGNLGTTYRHRGEVVWVIGLLAALGAERLWARRRV